MLSCKEGSSDIEKCEKANYKNDKDSFDLKTHTCVQWHSILEYN